MDDRHGGGGASGGRGGTRPALARAPAPARAETARAPNAWGRAAARVAPPRPPWPRQARPGERGAGMREIFRAADTDTDGRVTLAELRAEIGRRFQAADADRDGAVTRAEFERLSEQPLRSARRERTGARHPCPDGGTASAHVPRAGRRRRWAADSGRGVAAGGIAVPPAGLERRWRAGAGGDRPARMAVAGRASRARPWCGARPGACSAALKDSALALPGAAAAGGGGGKPGCSHRVSDGTDGGAAARPCCRTALRHPAGGPAGCSACRGRGIGPLPAGGHSALWRPTGRSVRNRTNGALLGRLAQGAGFAIERAEGREREADHTRPPVRCWGRCAGVSGSGARKTGRKW